MKRVLLSIGAAMVLAGFAAMAAEPAPAPAPAAGDAGTQVTEQIKTQEKGVTFWGLYKQGGWCMVPLTMLSVASVGLIVFGFMSVRSDKMLSPEIVSQLQTSLDTLNVAEASNMCAGKPSLLTNILQAGLQRISDGVLDVPAMEKAM